MSLEFGEREIFEKDGKFDADAFKSAVEDKLKEQQVTISSGSVVTADNLIGVNVSEHSV